MEEQMEEEKETYDEVKEAIDVLDTQDDEEPQEEKPKSKAKAKSKVKPEPKSEPKSQPKPEPAKPGKNDKVECDQCGKTMNANTLRYRHVCKPPKSQEIQREKPRREPQMKRNRDMDVSPESPRTKMVQYYREARIAQQDKKRAMYASWLGN